MNCCILLGLLIIIALESSKGTLSLTVSATLERVGGFSLTSVSHKTQAAKTALFCPSVILHQHNFI